MPENWTTALMVAVINERVVDYVFGPLFKYFKWDPEFKKYAALATGCTISIVSQLTLFPQLNPVVDLILTGVLIGGGSNFVHDIWDLLNSLINKLRFQ